MKFDGLRFSLTKKKQLFSFILKIIKILLSGLLLLFFNIYKISVSTHLQHTIKKFAYILHCIPRLAATRHTTQ